MAGDAGTVDGIVSGDTLFMLLISFDLFYTKLVWRLHFTYTPAYSAGVSVGLRIYFGVIYGTLQ